MRHRAYSPFDALRGICLRIDERRGKPGLDIACPHLSGTTNVNRGRQVPLLVKGGESENRRALFAARGPKASTGAPLRHFQ